MRKWVRLVNGLIETLRKLGAARLGAMVAVAAILIGFFVYIIGEMTAPRMTVLYTDLEFSDSTAVIRQLESLGVTHEVRREGAVILVPHDEVLKVRMRMAEQGLPTGGSIGYEIFDKSDTLGATSFVQNINHLRALEGELARTIKTISRVVTARVHLVLPTKELFSREKKQPTASIVVKVRGSLDGGQIKAIQHLVASAVQGLKPSRVSIVDETGRLLANGADDESNGLIASTLQERTVSYETRLRRHVEEILNSVVGPGRARVRVAAELDFNRITTTTKTFDPEGKVVRSSQSREQNSSSARAGTKKGVTVGNQLPNSTAAATATGGDKDTEATSSTEEVFNYEISSATKTETTEAGRIKRLSVAVLVDGTYATKDTGEVAYSPRNKEDLDRIAALVRSAIGFDEKRGDVVEVVNLKFAEAPDLLKSEAVEGGFFDFTKDDLFYFAQLAITLVLGILVLLFGVRPLIRRIVTEDEQKPAPALLTDESGHQVDEEGNLIASAAGPEPEPSAAATSRAIADAQAEGEVHANTIASVGQLVEDNPNEAVVIVRSWLHEAA